MLHYSDCPLCGSGNSSTIYTEGANAVVRCKGCGFMFKNPRDQNHIDTNRNREYYNAEFLRSKAAHLSLFREKYDEFLKESGPGRILDIGCATGEFLTVGSEKGWDVTGIDVSEWACTYLKGRGFNQVYCTDIDSSDFPNDYFDVVNINHTLEHVLYPIKTLQSIYRVLKPGGLLLVEVPNEILFPYNYKLINLLLPRHLPRRKTSHSHYSLFTPKSLATALKDGGFHIRTLREEGFSSNSRIKTNTFKKKSFLVKLVLLMCSMKLDVYLKLGRYIVAVAEKKEKI